MGQTQIVSGNQQPRKAVSWALAIDENEPEKGCLPLRLQLKMGQLGSAPSGERLMSSQILFPSFFFLRGRGGVDGTQGPPHNATPSSLT